MNTRKGLTDLAAVVDMRSDTVTMPTEEMMQAVAHADLGDDVYGEDAATTRLEEYAAGLLGKEAGLFVASGTMGNLVAVLTHTQHRRPELIAETRSHMVDYEGGNMSHFGGVAVRAIDGVWGMPPPQQVRQAIRDPHNLHHPVTALICLENTHANAGGTVLDMAEVAEVKAIADENSIPTHLDGARLFNAAVALGRPVAELAKPFDSVQVCLSKGLSAPVGSLLVGQRDFIREARHYRKMLGGGMRQSGILAAAGLVALTTMVDRLQEDHDNARRLARGLNDIPGFRIDLDSVQTNIVCANVQGTGASADELVARFEEAGVRCLSRGPQTLRFLLHRHISAEDVASAVQAIRRCFTR